MSAIPDPYFSLEDYFALEARGEGKHEYYRGEIFAMTGGTARHSQIAVNVTSSLTNQLRGKSCVVYNSDLRVKIEASSLYTYPDALVICGPAQYDGKREDIVLNPTLIVEVLSSSTEQYDRGKKFQHYRKIPSLQAYLLITQEAMLVELYTRWSETEWRLSDYSAPDAEIPLPAIDAVVQLADIYEKVQFEDAGESTPSV